MAFDFSASGAYPVDMAEPDKALSRRSGYHHGNLKEALVEAARRLVAERGPAGFTLVEAARLAGVSPAAPYRHFKDRRALIAELRRRGCALFAERLGAAARDNGPMEAFRNLGPAYLAFAREEPGYYAAMFVSGDAPGSGADDARDAFAALEAALSGIGGAPAGEHTRLLALQIWALSHGIAMLEAAGLMPPHDLIDPETVLASAARRLVRGAAAEPGNPAEPSSARDPA